MVSFVVILTVSLFSNPSSNLTYVVYFSYFSFSPLSIYFLDPPLDVPYLLYDLVWDAYCLLCDLALKTRYVQWNWIWKLLNASRFRIAATLQKSVVNAWVEERVQKCNWICKMMLRNAYNVTWFAMKNWNLMYSLRIMINGLGMI